MTCSHHPTRLDVLPLELQVAPCVSMVAELVPVLQSAGWSHVRTVDGLIELEAWRPYGSSSRRVAWSPLPVADLELDLTLTLYDVDPWPDRAIVGVWDLERPVDDPYTRSRPTYVLEGDGYNLRRAALVESAARAQELIELDELERYLTAGIGWRS